MDVVVPPYRTKGFHNPYRERGFAEKLAMRGETIFHLLLEEKGITHEWWKITKAFTKQRYDFKVYELTIDVKTRPLGKDEFLMKAIDTVECDYYVAVNASRMVDNPVFVHGEKAYGYLTKAEVIKLPIVELPLYPGRRCPYQDLHPIEDLLSIFSRGCDNRYIDYKEE